MHRSGDPSTRTVGARGHDGAVTTTELSDAALRDRAEHVLRTLAGPTAQLAGGLERLGAALAAD